MDNQDQVTKSKVKQLARARVDELTKKLVGESKWSLLEIILQEIVATYICTGDKKPELQKLVELLKAEVELRYNNDTEVKEILLEGIPSIQAISKWMKKDGWDEAVWGHIKKDGLFTSQKRQELINALFERAKDKSDVAAKLWLTMSGDYSEKMDISSDATVDQFREIQQSLLKKKHSNDSA